MIVHGKPKKRKAVPRYTKEQKQQYFVNLKEQSTVSGKIFDTLTEEQRETIAVKSKQGGRLSIKNYFWCLNQAQGRDMNNYQGIIYSYRHWKEQGITVLRGEKGLKVYIPCFYSKADVAKANDSRLSGKVKYFSIGTVFDISQTSAADQAHQYLNDDKKGDVIMEETREYREEPCPF